MRTITHFIAGANAPQPGARTGDVYNPSTGQIQARVELANPAHLDKAVADAKAAQPAWAAQNPQKRARVMMKMTHTINAEYLTQLTDPKPTQDVNCGTCHRGELKPVAFVPPPSAPRAPGPPPGAAPPPPAR